MLWDRIVLLLAFTHLAASKQPSAPSSVEAPLRELPWGKLNFLHTTDTHGWHAGHLREPQYSADWGDYISFAQHLHARADADGSDLLLIDTGDRVEGNGLYDTSKPPGKYTFDIVKQQKFDVVTVGNHELYINTTSLREYDDVVPGLQDAYIASNVDVRNPKDGKLVPLAKRFRKFKTKNQGIRVLAFGFLFDFSGNADNTFVQRVEDTVKEAWFQDAIREMGVDLFLVAGHVPVRNTQEFDAVYKAIRDVKWDTPIVFFGGHTHIRDYRRWEDSAYGIESGRYMETIGFLSISGLSSSGKDVAVSTRKNPTYKRMYIDNNLYSLHHHSATNKSTFDTELGRNVSKQIKDARSELKLDQTFGCAPHDLWLNRAPYPSNDSLLTWLADEVLPDTFGDSNSSSNPAIVITNSGALRFDIFRGPFTTDATYLLCPFKSGFRKLQNVPYGAASKVLKTLNNEGPIPLKDLLSFVSDQPGCGKHRIDDLVPHLPQVAQSGVPTTQTFPSVKSDEQIPFLNANKDKDKDEPQVPGYTTRDDAGDGGDDTIHQPIKFYAVPNCVGSEIGFSSSADSTPESVDLIYNEFVQGWVLLALQYLGVSYGVENTRSALEGKSMTDVIKDWVGENWQCEE
ncbi:Metallo-dependent phosphatase-like protein [Neohortaea acidophila]|uniref:Metallo-dependent phosphatase-like protein n=1 Tax=Neohortaea acidophila TaxID=245834 RepID=A0A6A6Q7I6_9PEZI|nr:Metallo-dependent phosphatase-like protein [Neohortaea acidophila]KAF2487613.1 Metallo-dependent phosphatase-like protein [Neohortaea acidophila]